MLESGQRRRSAQNILVDGREFGRGIQTGIGSVLDGFISALSASKTFQGTILLAVYSRSSIPERLKKAPNVVGVRLPPSFLRSEKKLSSLSASKECGLFLSPYPKLPLFGVGSFAVNIIHDVLDLTYPPYNRRLKMPFDKFRVARSLRRADATWYVSRWSMEETRRLFGVYGKNPKVRYPGIADNFSPHKNARDEAILRKFGLSPGYVLVVGNGLPHKNLEILRSAVKTSGMKFVFIGLKGPYRKYWKDRLDSAATRMLPFVEAIDMPAIFRAAYCLAQPSIIEGFCYPPLEAMASGTPAVVSRIPVLQETTGGNALMADPNESSEWPEALDILRSAEKRQEIIEEGLQWVEPFMGAKGWKKQVNDAEAYLST